MDSEAAAVSGLSENDDGAKSDQIDGAPDAASSMDTATAGPSNETESKETKETKVGMLKAPKRRNLRHILAPEEIGAETLEERRREQERQQRLQFMFASQMYQQQHQQSAYLVRPHVSFQNYLSDEERREIAARQAAWRNFKQSKFGIDDVVVLSSDDEDGECKPREAKRRRDSGGESDCVCIESDSGDERGGGDADVATVAAHVNDLFNVPDEQGRVLINVGHPESEDDVFLPQHLAGVVKPHQIGGLRFMYDNIVESLQRFKPNGGFGCILAHSMGLGKTFQVVSFTDIVYRHTPIKRILLIVPINTLQNWVHEFEMWTPKSALQPDVTPRQFDVALIAEGCNTWTNRVAVINEWYKSTGVLILGYEMFRILANKIGGVNKSKKPNTVGVKGSNGAGGAHKDDGDLDLTEVAKALLDPGPDLVVCDEGHRIKNFQSHTSKALSSIKTKRRIVLTGYPLQNNLMEYWCMVNFVRPNYLGTRKEFANVFERPVRNGQCVDSTATDIKLMRYRVHVLTNLLKGFVQRRSHTLLAKTLPPKLEYVLFVRKSPIQHRLYRRFIIECTADIREDVGSWNPLKAFAVFCKIWNHPDVLYKAYKARLDVVDGDLDVDLVQSCPSQLKDKQQSGSSNGFTPESGGFFPFRPKKEEKRHIDYRWAEEIFWKYSPGVLEHGMKMRLALALIEHSVRKNDKILVYSQSLLTLDALETFLAQRALPQTDEKWRKNRNYFRLDGSTNSTERQRLIARFNNERGVHLFLISTRAGCLGINLVGANRVIVFDASFNPCHDAQAVCRVYRYGQKKPAYIYRLVTDNSMEKTIFNRQLGKQGIADRVVDERVVDTALCRQDLYDLLQYNEEEDTVTEDCKIDPDNVKDELLLDVCIECVDCLTKEPVPHESLMLDRGEQQLSEEEKREARRGYEREKKMLKNGTGGGIDWKKWKTDNGGDEGGYSGHLVRQQQPWMSCEPPPIRCTPVPMVLQSTAYPPAANGLGSYGQLNPQNAPNLFVRPAVLAGPNGLTLPPGQFAKAREDAAPELITLSDDEA